MKFYDLMIQNGFPTGENTIQEIADFAKKMGYSGIAICDKYHSKEKLDELLTEIKNVKTDIEIYPGVTIEAKTVAELKEKITKVREKVTVLIVAGGDYAINRAACEDSRVDILMHPEFGRFDNGLDEPCMQMAAQNNVAIGISFRNVMNTFRRIRSYLLQKLEQNIILCEKYKIPIILCSGAQNTWEMRAPRDLISVVNVLGMEISRAFLSMTTVPLHIIEDNTKTLEGKRITEGVEIVE